ncbi:hypothetical protein JCM4814A_94240 [Streptomyces phaeofaciens JCM 4814]|uniref:Helicase n=1 Tax=Streptomyces phaeofaciens TaxID=68254 RepID=A0A918HSY1_9ACTN|nr:hypothetical protein GCM10010226_90870 [Streptomyces phaeofaciens]
MRSTARRAAGRALPEKSPEHVAVPGAHVETVVVDGQEHAVKLGVGVMNVKGRRAGLSADRLARLAALGLDWAA